jgi:hypothetical protein
MTALNQDLLRAAPPRWVPHQRALPQTAEPHGQPSSAMTEPSHPRKKIEEPGWSARTPAVHIERTVDAEGRSRVSMVRHPTHPFPGHVSGHDDRFAFNELFALAEDYLVRLADATEVKGPLRVAARSLKERQRSGFAWLGVAANEGQEPDGRLSFLVSRGSGKEADHTYVLLAGNQRQLPEGRQVSYGGRIGLRVVAHVGTARDGRRPVRITGASFSAVDLAWTALTEPLRIGKTTYHPRGGGIPIEIFFEPIVQALGFDTLSIDGLSVLQSQQSLYLSGTAAQIDKVRRIYAWGVRIPLQRDDKAGMLVAETIQVEPDYRLELLSHLISSFERDPASMGPAASMRQRAPTRDEARLDPLRTGTAWLQAAPSGEVQLVLDDPAHPRQRWLEVRESRLRSPENVAVQQVADDPAADLPLRSHDLAAVHAWQRGAELFERIGAYGLQVQHLFRLAGLPLVMRHHDALRGANDGRVINAQVRPTAEARSLDEPYRRDQLPLLEVIFGVATTTHHAVNGPGHPRSEPLGLAADSRWAWHEFGHVLCYASTGDIELPFAHSAGDAMAAIVADPDSGLQDPPARHITFPWVRTGRRHDRNPLLGWCWCGRRNTRRLAGVQRRPMAFTGYFAEQLLSSSLFRAYESLGGAGGSPDAQRRRASDYMLYLLMRATALLGTASTVPASTADQFVSALIDADIGTTHWNINRTWGAGAPQALARTGGAAHKPIRWAFEQQGLYAVDDTGATVEYADRPGRAPAVDVHIPGRGRRADGGYDPVPLRWDDSEAQPWHADPAAIHWDGFEIQVQVGNRGTLPAENVEVAVWVSPPGGLAWVSAGTVAVAHIGAEVGIQPASFVSTVAAAPGAVVLAIATCAADRANSDPAAGLACAFTAPPTDFERLLDLVANDNNIGLRIIPA